MDIKNLGNVTGLIKSATAPIKTYVIWAKQLDPLGNPDLVELMRYDGTTWIPLGGSSVLIDEEKTLEVVFDGVGAPDYTVPIYTEVPIRHTGVYNKVLTENVDIDFGSGVQTCDAEVIVFSGYVDSSLFGAEFSDREIISYRRLSCKQGATVIYYEYYIVVGNSKMQYRFNKTTGTAEHNFRVEISGIDNFDIHITAMVLDDTGAITDLTPTVSTSQTHWYQKTMSLNNFGLTMQSITATDLILIATSYLNGDNPTVNDLSSDFGVEVDGVSIGFTISKIGGTEYQIIIPFANLDFVGKGNGNFSLKIFGHGSQELESCCRIIVDGTAYQRLLYIDDCRVWTQSNYPLHAKATPIEAIAPAFNGDGKRNDLILVLTEAEVMGYPFKVYASYEHQAYTNPFPEPIFHGKKPLDAFMKTYYMQCETGFGTVYNKINAFYEIQGKTL